MDQMSFIEKWRLLNLSEQEVEDMENGIPEKTARAAEPQPDMTHMYSRSRRTMTRDELMASEMQKVEWVAATGAARVLAQNIAQGAEYAHSISKSINGSDAPPCERSTPVVENAVVDTGETYVEVVRRSKRSKKKQEYKHFPLIDLTGNYTCWCIHAGRGGQDCA